ncbi:MAG: hypothetical protein ACTSWN_07805 [Promethearchaeota archaeon]
MYTNDYVAPFFQGEDTDLKINFNLYKDISALIIKKFFETGGKIEKKLGDLISLAVGYWPFYIVPLGSGNAYILDGKSVYKDKIKTWIVKEKLPDVAKILDESSIDAFISSMEKHVRQIEVFRSFEREEKVIDGLIPVNAFQTYFLKFFRRLEKPYYDSSFALEPSLSSNAVEFIHEEVMKIFNDDIFRWMDEEEKKVKDLCQKWISKIQKLLDDQEQDPVQSLKNKGLWHYPQIPDSISALLENTEKIVDDIKNNGEEEKVGENINLCDQGLNKTFDIKKVFEDYKRSLKALDEQIRLEANEIAAERKYWQESIDKIRSLIEREIQAIKAFRESETQFRNTFINERGITFKTDKVVSCGVPIFLMNFQKKDKVDTYLNIPLLVGQASKFGKNPFVENKSYNEFSKAAQEIFLKSLSEIELQKNIQNQDLFTLPNLKIHVSDGIDKFLELGFIDQKRQSKIQEELQAIFTKGM